MKNKDKFTSAAEAVREVIATMNKGTIFNGYDLKEKSIKLYPDGSKMYVDTFLREMRSSCSDDYELISRAESLYRKTTKSRAEKRHDEFIKYQQLKQPELFEGGI